MKASRFVMLMASVGLVLGMMTGCGGGGSGDGGTSETPITSTPDSPSVVTIEDVLEKENKQADQFVSQIIAYTDAANKYIDVFEAATLGLDVEQMSLEDLINVLGEEEVNSLANQLITIYDEKMVPSLSAAHKAGNDMIVSEQHIKEILSRTSKSTLIAEGFMTSRTFKALDSELAVEPFTTGVCIVAAGGIILATGSAILACVDAVLKEQEACIAADMKKFPSHSRIVAGLACTLQNPNALQTCGKEVAILATTTAASIATTGFKAVQFGIDTLSGALSALGIYEVVGERCGDSKPDSNNRLVMTEDIQKKNIGLNPDATTYIGKGNADGIFLVPEGKWNFVTFADGYVRQFTGCVDVSGPEDIIKHNVTMAPTDKMEDVTCDSMNIQVSIPGYTHPFASNLTKMSFGSINDGPNIYPGFVTTNANSLEEYNQLKNDTLVMLFNTTLSAGKTYPLNGNFELEYGDLWFHTPQILNDNGYPVAFVPVSGSFTLTEFGTNVGDRVSGSFSCDVTGSVDKDTDVNGHISGTFSGVLTAPEQNSAVSKSMKISF